MATEKRLRVSFDAESEVIRRAIYIAAAMRGKTHNEVMNDLVRDHLGNYLEMAKKALAEDVSVPRKRKSSDS